MAQQCVRDQVVLVTRLEHVSTGHHVTVANLHTIWENFSQLDVASLHVALVLNLLQGEEGALLVTGDFNSLPEMEPYLLLTQGGLTEEQLQALGSKGSGSLGPAAGPITSCLSSLYRDTRAMDSAYKTIKGEEPRLTNYDDYDSFHPADWCLDYISYSRETLRPVAVLETVGVPDGRLPDATLPSDHLSLKATFSFLAAL